jgi:kynurenine formamidase/predicted nucleotidyltransferase
MFGIEEIYKKRIDAFILQYPYAFYVYGSRSKGTERPSSDLDLCIISKITMLELAEIKECLNNLMLPFTIDLVSWMRLSDEFKSLIKALIKDDLKAYTPDPWLGAEVIELSYPISKNTPAWPGKKFDIQVEMDYPQKFRVQTYSFSAGIGTHIDTPSHMIPGGKDLGSLDFKTLFAPCSILVAPQNAAHSFILTEMMIRKHEESFGPIMPNSWFLVMTGWGMRSENEQAYQNMDVNNRMHFPKISEDAANYLMQKKILGIGIDTLSPDGNDLTFPVHKKILEAGAYIIENLVFHQHACSNQWFLQVIPLNIVGGTESPVRVLLIKQR